MELIIIWEDVRIGIEYKMAKYDEFKLLEKSTGKLPIDNIKFIKSKNM